MTSAIQYTYKSHHNGTHRTCAPDLTWKHIAPWLSYFGITRIAPVTGLDVVGIPTVMAIRPAARGLSVAQGKGVDEMSARVSGAMEAIEHAVAEGIVADRLHGSVSELKTRYRIPQIERIASRSGELGHDTQILWIQGVELASGECVICPYELVHLDLRVPEMLGSGYFQVSSNGLASGNSLIEATCHALFEVIERDASARFFALRPQQQNARRVSLGSVDSPTCARLLEHYAMAEVDVAIWDITSALGLPAFMCDIIDRPVHAMRGLQRARGVGCHSTSEIALTRALCEAAQARLTHIVGSRDDISAAELSRARTPQAIERARQQIAGDGARRYAMAPDRQFEAFEAELAWLIKRLQAQGYREIVRVVLRNEPGEPFAVVRVVVPGLLAPGPHAARKGSV